MEGNRAAAINTEWLWTLATILSYLLLPCRLLLSGLLYLLGLLLAPLLLLGRIGARISMLPVRFLAQFETFYIFFGVAIAVGIVFGLALHLLVRFATRLFDLDRPTLPRDRAARGHSASSYRAAREKRRRDEELRKAARSRLLATEPLLGLGGKGKEPKRTQTSALSPTSPRPGASLLSTTILEEVDDSDEGYGF